MASSTETQEIPSQEQVLQLIENNGGQIKDTRLLYKGEVKSNVAQDPKAAEESFRRRADWQLGLQGVLSSLKSREMITYTILNEISYVPSSEGHLIAQQGSPEARVWSALPVGGKEGKSLEELRTALGADVLKFGQGKAFAKKWVKKDPSDDKKLIRVEGLDTIRDETQDDLREIIQSGQIDGGSKAGEKRLAEMKKRNLIVPRKLLYFDVVKGPNFSLTMEKFETDLTADMIASGAWKKANFKQYNFDAAGAVPAAGVLHPLLKVREEFRNIFFEMGFAEMPTNRFVDSSFWCFDALYVPQQHAARDVQDTFFVKDPPAAKHIPEDYLKRVVEAHENGSFGSIGYRYKFSRQVTEKLVLRTHTTAVSAAMLYSIANQPGGFKPAKLFSIDRVFRNEAVDATHLAEFHQVEGVVADYNITLGDLIGFMQIFFSKMGVTNLRFKPAYNPYTEPSLEIFSYHAGLKKWVEIGNSGMFRPEMLRPMGLPEGVNVLGWGLSLERPTMIRYGINNIRDLLGHKISIDSVQKAAAVRFP